MLHLYRYVSVFLDERPHVMIQDVTSLDKKFTRIFFRIMYYGHFHAILNSKFALKVSKMYCINMSLLRQNAQYLFIHKLFSFNVQNEIDEIDNGMYRIIIQPIIN